MRVFYDKTEMVIVLVVVSMLSICLLAMTEPNPLVERVEPSLIWKTANVLMTLSRWPTVIPLALIIATICIQLHISGSPKKETSKEKIARLLNQNKELAIQLRYANYTVERQTEELVKLKIVKQRFEEEGSWVLGPPEEEVG
jgi:hypothetical protein